MLTLEWFSYLFYRQLLSDLSLFLCRFSVHPRTKAHIFDFDPQPKKLCRECVDPSTKRPKWLKLHPHPKIGRDQIII